MQVWHKILGHRDIDAIKKTPSVVDGMQIDRCGSACSRDCEACIVGKMSKTKFPKKSESRSEAALDLIHSDICGPMQTETPQGKRYILTFIDDHSRYAAIYLLRAKSEALARFRDFQQLMKNQFGRGVKAFRSDRGGEYVSGEFMDFLNSEGIKVRRTAPYSPQQNGVRSITAGNGKMHAGTSRVGETILGRGNRHSQFHSKSSSDSNPGKDTS